MDSLEISEQLAKIAIVLGNTETAVNKLAQDTEELETRIVRIEQQIEVSSHAMKNFWERDVVNMMTEMRSINEKLQQQLSNQAQHKSEVELVKQRVDFVCKVYDDKISKLEKIVEQSQMALWKLIGVGAGSGAVITGVIEILSGLMK